MIYPSNDDKAHRGKRECHACGTWYGRRLRRNGTAYESHTSFEKSKCCGKKCSSSRAAMSRNRLRDLTGMRFGKLIATTRGTNTANGHARWTCICGCGSSRLVLTYSLTSGHTVSCGRGPCGGGFQALDLRGERYGLLVVQKMVETPEGSRSKSQWWKCRCDCGRTKIVSAKKLRSRATSSCGATACTKKVRSLTWAAKRKIA